MFDAATSALLRSAPAVPGLDPNDIPQLITEHYAALVSARLRGTSDGKPADEHWTLERIADTYEIITSISDDLQAHTAVFSSYCPLITGMRSSLGADPALICGDPV